MCAVVICYHLSTVVCNTYIYICIYIHIMCIHLSLPLSLSIYIYIYTHFLDQAITRASSCIRVDSAGLRYEHALTSG